MSGSSDDEPDVPVEAPKPDFSLMPVVILVCILCYIYGAWFGVYMCPK